MKILLGLVMLLIASEPTLSGKILKKLDKELKKMGLQKLKNFLADIDENAVKIGNISSIVDDNDAAISNITSSIVGNELLVADNAANIASNAANISNNDAAISSITSSIVGIADNAADIASNAADITSSIVGIADNAADIASNAAAITSNAADIASNAASVNEAFALSLTKDGPYGSEGGSPWTDFNTFKENGPLTAIEIRAGGAIDALRARYGNTWGDWHGGNGGGGFAPFEIVLIGANGIINLSEGGTVDGIVFWGNDGTNYGPYGGPSGNEPWETTFNSALGCRVQYLSGRAGGLLDAISFHHNCNGGV